MAASVLQCPLCNKPFQVLAEQAGSVVRCPSCQQAVMVPDSIVEKSPAPTTPSANLEVFACPVCNGKFGVSPDQFGQQVACPHCESTVQVGEDSAQPKNNRLQPPPLIETKANQDANEVAAPPIVETEPENELKPSAPINASVNADEQPESIDESNPEEKAADTAPTESPEPKTPEPFVPKNVDHLLPPKFDVVDPEMLAFTSRSKAGNAIAIPDGKGGYKKVDQRIVKVMHGDKEVSLIALPPEVVRRKRMIQNMIFLVGGGILLAMIFALLNRAV